MAQVGIKELKARLSQYIQLVKKGEKVIITDHDVIVAELRKPEDTKSDTKLEDIINNLVSEHKLTRAERGPSELPQRPKSKTTIKKSEWWSIYEKSKEDSNS